MTTADETTEHYLAPGLAQPRPARDGLDAPYWEGARENRLMVQHCEGCGGHQWGPEWMCHACHRMDPGWAEVEGRGVIYAWQRVHHPVHPALADQGPYLVVLVELPHADGIRMVGNLLGDPMQPVAIGDAVTAVFEHHNDADEPYTLVQWRMA